MDLLHHQHSPASLLSESDLDEASSSASSPMSISSVEASSPYDSSRLGGDDDLTLSTDSSFCSNSTVISVACTSSSPPPSPADSTVCNSNYSNRNDSDDAFAWASNPYHNASKSIRWFRDDRGLWSERSNSSYSSSSRTARSSPYQRTNIPSRQVDNNNKETSEVLLDAVRRQDTAQLRHLLQQTKSAAQVNILGHEGDSPLHRSCRQGHLDTVKLLVRYGADPDLTNRDGWSPLHLAVHSGCQDVVVYLLSLTRH